MERIVKNPFLMKFNIIFLMCFLLGSPTLLMASDGVSSDVTSPDDITPPACTDAVAKEELQVTKKPPVLRLKAKIEVKTSGANTGENTVNLSELEKLLKNINVHISQGKSTEYNTSIFREIGQLLYKKINFEFSELKEFRSKLLEVLTKKYSVDKKKKNDQVLWYLNTQQIADERVIVSVISKIDSLLELNAKTEITRKEAFKLLLLSSSYNFIQYVKTWPSLRVTIHNAMQFYKPKALSTYDEINLVYQAVARRNIKVPDSWQQVSIEWLKEKFEKMPFFISMKLYKNMLKVGIKPSVAIENLIYSHLDENKTYPEHELQKFFEIMARALLAPSLHLTKDQIKPHFIRLQNAIEKFRIKVDGNHIFQLFYVIAANRLGLFDEEKYDAIYDSIKNSVVSRRSSGNAQKSPYYHELKRALSKFYPGSTFDENKMLVNYLQPIHFLEENKGWIIQLHEPGNTSWVFSDTYSDFIDLNASGAQDLEFISQQIYELMEYKVVRIPYILLDKSEDIISNRLIQLLEE